MKQFLLLSLIALLFGCAKDAPEPIPENTFQQFIATDSALVAGLTDVDRLQALIADNHLSVAEQQEIPALYGFKSPDEFQSVMSKQLERKQEIYKQYRLAKLDDNERLQLFNSLLKTDQIKQEARCDDEQRDCLISTTAMATLLHYGCVSVDITFWGGVICHSAVVMWHSAENRRCLRAYQICKENQLAPAQ